MSMETASESFLNAGLDAIPARGKAAILAEWSMATIQVAGSNDTSVVGDALRVTSIDDIIYKTKLTRIWPNLHQNISQLMQGIYCSRRCIYYTMDSMA
jgi:hypothetical protein